MKRTVLATLMPPLAVCRYGCASCCAAPIGVFWLAGIISLVYGYNGGPLGLDGVSWYTLGLGAALLGISVVWAQVTLRNVDEDKCRQQERKSRICDMIPGLDESDPLEQVRKRM